MISKDEVRLQAIAEGIDAFITIDFFARGFLRPVYQAIREKIGVPLTYHAAKGLAEALQTDNSSVLIATGFLIAPSMKPETDGPIGAAVLARALSLGFNTKPIIVAEAGAISSLKGACTAAGLHVYEDPKQAAAVPHSVALVSFPTDKDASTKLSNEIIDSFDPKAMISIEHPGRSVSGIYHDGHGGTLDDWVAPIEDLFALVKERGGFTVGIGDVGNEIGFGSVRDDIAPFIPYGAKCKCPCGKGLVSASESDAPIFANVSELGSYALIAALAAVTGRDILHDADLQEFVTKQAVLTGAVEGDGGRCEYAIDMIDVKYYRDLINILHAILRYADMTIDHTPHFLRFMEERMGAR